MLGVVRFISWGARPDSKEGKWCELNIKSAEGGRRISNHLVAHHLL
jgi:hypothetical protein